MGTSLGMGVNSVYNSYFSSFRLNFWGTIFYLHFQSCEIYESHRGRKAIFIILHPRIYDLGGAVMSKNGDDKIVFKLMASIYHRIFEEIDLGATPIIPLLGDKNFFVISREKFVGYLTYSIHYPKANPYFIYDAILNANSLKAANVEDIIETGNSLTEALNNSSKNSNHCEIENKLSLKVNPLNVEYISPSCVAPSEQLCSAYPLLYIDSLENDIYAYYTYWTSHDSMPLDTLEVLEKISINDIVEFFEIVKGLEKEKITKLGEISKEVYTKIKSYLTIHKWQVYSKAFDRVTNNVFPWFVAEIGKDGPHFKAYFLSQFEPKIVLLSFLYYFPKSFVDSILWLNKEIENKINENSNWPNKFKENIISKYSNQISSLIDIVCSIV